MALLSVIAGAAMSAALSPLLAAAAARFTTTDPGPLHRRGRVLLAIGAAVAGAAVATLPAGPLTVLYGGFAATVLTAAIVDALELRIPNRLTYPTLLTGILLLPLTSDLSTAGIWGPAAGAAASGLWALVMALVADQGLGDVKLAAAIGAWTAHLGVLPWILGVLLSQVAVAGVLAASVRRNRRTAGPRSYTPLGPALTIGAVLAIGASTLI